MILHELSESSDYILQLYKELRGGWRDGEGGLCSNASKNNSTEFSSWFLLKTSWHNCYTSLVLYSSAEEFLKLCWNEYALFYPLSEYENKLELDLAPVILQYSRISSVFAVQCTAVQRCMFQGFQFLPAKWHCDFSFYSKLFLWVVIPTLFYVNFRYYSPVIFFY